MKFLKKHSGIIRNIYVSLLASLISLVFAKLYYSAIWELKRNSDVIYADTPQVFLFQLLGAAIVIFAVIMVYYYFDNLDLFNKRDYHKEERKRLLISKPGYIIGFAIAICFATSMLTRPIHDLLLVLGDVNIAWARLIAIFTLMLIRLIQLCNLQAKWNDEIEHPMFVEKPIFKRSQDIEGFKIRHLFLRPLGFVAIFTLCYLAAYSYLLATFSSVFFILTSLWQGILLIALVPFIIILTVRFSANIRSRHKLIKKLKYLEKNGYAAITYQGRKYLSAIFPRLNFSIEVRAQSGETYLCRVVCSGRVNAPMYFTEDKYYTEHGFHLRGGGLISSMGASPFAAVVDIGKWGGKTNPTNLIAGYRREHDIEFPEKEGDRALIVNPAPTACFSLYENIANPIDTGENMGKYTVYSATGFCNMIERKANKDRFDR